MLFWNTDERKDEKDEIFILCWAVEKVTLNKKFSIHSRKKFFASILKDRPNETTSKTFVQKLCLFCFATSIGKAYR